MASGDTKTEALLNILGNGGDASEYKGCCNSKTQNYILDAIDRVQNVEDEVEELKNNPDVVDIVDTYADLEAYDTSSLTDKDIIRVLQDSNYNNNSTYYRWNASTSQFDFVGEAGSGVNVVQTTGNSTTDVMSQDATTKMVFKDGDTSAVCIGTSANTSTQYPGVAIGHYADSSGERNGIAIGRSSKASSRQSICIGSGTDARAGQRNICIGEQAQTDPLNASVGYGIALGAHSKISHSGEFNVGLDNYNYGYNNTPYRLLTGLYDGQSAHDAATVGQLDGRVLQNAGAPTTATVGTLGQLLEDTTNAKLYQCTAVTGDGGNPEVFTYTWTEVGAGGGGGVTILTTADYNYPEGSPDGIALWLLPDGDYQIGADAYLKVYIGRMYPGGPETTGNWISNKFTVYGHDISYEEYIYIRVLKATESVSSHRFENISSFSIHKTDQVYDRTLLNGIAISRNDVVNLANISSPIRAYDQYLVTSAEVGKTLNNRLVTGLTSAPAGGTRGEVGTLATSIESGTPHLYICTASSGGTNTWQQLI